MEELLDLLSNNNFSKSSTELSSEESPAAEANTGSEVDMIENLINQMNQTVSDPVDNHGIIEGQNVGIKLQDPPNVDEILKADDASITPNLHNVSVINAACQQVLKHLEQQLLTLLKQNRKEQDVIQAFLNANCKNSYFENRKKNLLKCAGMPYFKDNHGFPPPPNEDVLKKKKNKKLLPMDYIKSFPVWNVTDAKTLINAVKEYDLSKPVSIDWMKISVTDLGGKYSPSECKSKWTLHLNPDINKSKWSSKEMESLKALCSKYNAEDWDKIAAELGTNRTGLQCCIQYQIHTIPTEGKWTPEEDETLKQLVEKFRVRDCIPWTKVAWYFESRSQKQCHERYAYRLTNIKRGNFSMEEDFVIVYLASKLKNFGEVAKFLPGRVSTQIRARYEYLVELSMPEFSKEEDELLIKLMAQYPRNWGKISEHFKNRSRVQCRKRWAWLQKRLPIEGEIHSESDDNESLDSSSKDNANIFKQSPIDAYNVKKNMQLISKPSQCVRKYPEIYGRLLDYHSHCHKFLFGPKPRLPTNAEELKALTTKMVITMKTLSISHCGILKGFDINRLTNNPDFDGEDLAVLNNLKRSEQNPRDFELSKKFIPPNYLTLLGLRTLTLAWNKIKNSHNFYQETPESCSSTVQISSEDRILCSDAKKLFKSRLRTIFAFPSFLSNISHKENEKLVYKPKLRKAVKPLSKRRRREHAKFMSAAYRNKIKTLCGQFPNAQGLLDYQNKTPEEELTNSSSKPEESVGSSVTKNEIKRKRPQSSKSEDGGVEPLKKRRTRKG